MAGGKVGKDDNFRKVEVQATAWNMPRFSAHIPMASDHAAKLAAISFAVVMVVSFNAFFDD
jgi:hypothetical protein